MLNELMQLRDLRKYSDYVSVAEICGETNKIRLQSVENNLVSYATKNLDRRNVLCFKR